MSRGDCAVDRLAEVTIIQRGDIGCISLRCIHRKGMLHAFNYAERNISIGPYQAFQFASRIEF
jgi:hypothetical protein